MTHLKPQIQLMGGEIVVSDPQHYYHGSTNKHLLIFVTAVKRAVEVNQSTDYSPSK
jgi:hypothetical protein